MHCFLLDLVLGEQLKSFLSADVQRASTFGVNTRNSQCLSQSRQRKLFLSGISSDIPVPDYWCQQNCDQNGCPQHAQYCECEKTDNTDNTDTGISNNNNNMGNLQDEEEDNTINDAEPNPNLDNNNQINTINPPNENNNQRPQRPSQRPPNYQNIYNQQRPFPNNYQRPRPGFYQRPPNNIQFPFVNNVQSPFVGNFQRPNYGNFQVPNPYAPMVPTNRPRPNFQRPYPTNNIQGPNSNYIQRPQSIYQQPNTPVTSTNLISQTINANLPGANNQRPNYETVSNINEVTNPYLRPNGQRPPLGSYNQQLSNQFGNSQRPGQTNPQSYSDNIAQRPTYVQRPYSVTIWPGPNRFPIQYQGPIMWREDQDQNENNNEHSANVQSRPSL